jgi:hypothetical protein
MAGCWVDVGEAARELDISTDDVAPEIPMGPEYLHLTASHSTHFEGLRL